MIGALAGGEIDMVASALTILPDRPGFEGAVFSRPYFYNMETDEKYGFGLREGSPLVQPVNIALKTIRESQQADTARVSKQTMPSRSSSDGFQVWATTMCFLL
jgi:ABC-type amino acid transport substrate-binding protein